MVSMRWTTTVLACDDPVPVARFWADLLGGEPIPVNDDFIVLQHGQSCLSHRIQDYLPVEPLSS